MAFSEVAFFKVKSFGRAGMMNLRLAGRNLTMVIVGGVKVEGAGLSVSRPIRLSLILFSSSDNLKEKV